MVKSENPSVNGTFALPADHDGTAAPNVVLDVVLFADGTA